MTNEILNAVILLGELHEHKYLNTRSNTIELYSPVNRISIEIKNEKDALLKYNVFDKNEIVELSKANLYDFLEKLFLRTNSAVIKWNAGELIEVDKWKKELKPYLIQIENEKNYNHYLKHSKVDSNRFELEYFDNIIIIRDKHNILMSNVLPLKNALQQWL